MQCRIRNLTVFVEISDWRTEYEDVSDLHYAAFYGDLASVKRIVKSDKSISADLQIIGGPKLLKQERQFTPDRFSKDCFFGFFLNSTPLMMACQQGHVDVVKYLIEHARADVNARDTLGVTPLGFAASAGQTEVVKFLLSKRAIMINIQEYYNGMTPLVMAVLNNHTETARLLTDRHANIHLKDKTGKRAIHYAAWNYNHELVSFLARHHDVDREVNAHDYQGNTPLHILVSDIEFFPTETDDIITPQEKGQIEGILTRMCKYPTSFVDIHRSVQRGSGKVGEEHTCLMKMLRMGADITARNNAGQTVLHVLCGRLPPVSYSQGYLNIDDPLQAQGTLVILNVLLKLGAACDVADYDGNTPLSLSRNQQNWLAVKLLGMHVHTEPRFEISADQYSSVMQTIAAFGGCSRVISLSKFEADIEFMSSALLADSKHTAKDRLAEKILNLQII